MSELILKTHYSVTELLSFKLVSLPNAHKNILNKAKREQWQSRKREGKGGGFEYALSSLPVEVQDEIRQQFAVSVVASKPKKSPVKLKNEDVSRLNAKQREIADARMALVAYVAELERVQSRISAMQFICEKAKCGQLSADLMALIDTANARGGKERGLSLRTLNQWVLDYHHANTPEERLLALAPRQKQAKKAEELPWLAEFLSVYRNTNGVCITEAYEIFSTQWQQALAQFNAD